MQRHCGLDRVFILEGIYTEAGSRDAEPWVMVEFSGSQLREEVGGSERY